MFNKPKTNPAPKAQAQPPIPPLPDLPSPGRPASPQAPAVVQAPDAPVMVQPYYQNTAVVPQAPPAVQISGRDDAFVF